MPVGCIHHFIVVKRSAVMNALEKAAHQGDQDRQKFARLMLSHLHSDGYAHAFRTYHHEQAMLRILSRTANLQTASQARRPRVARPVHVGL